MANTTSAPNHSGARGLSSREALVSVLESLRAVARRHSRVPHEADDLLQDALLEAMRVGRADLTQAVNYRWLVGTLRNLGVMTARSAVRRRLREAEWTDHQALLALSGHDRREVARLLGLSGTAMRECVSALRRRLPHDDAFLSEAIQSDALPLGLIRRALLPVVRATASAGSHDPDGHLITVSRSGAHSLPIGGNKRIHTMSHHIAPEPDS